MGASHTSNSSQNPCLAFSPGSAILLSSLTLCSMLAALMRVALKGWKMDTNHCQQQKIREFFPSEKAVPKSLGVFAGAGIIPAAAGPGSSRTRIFWQFPNPAICALSQEFG